MTTTRDAPQPSTSPEAAPVLVIRTGWADCHARFHPEHYQLVLERNGGEEKVELGYSGSRLLERLLRIPGDVVAREELLAHAWSDRVVGQGSLNQQVYTLRQLLGDETRREIIQTLPRRGYMFNPNCLVAAPSTEDAIKSEPAPRAPLTPAQRRLYGVLTGVGALLCLAALVSITIYYALFQTPVAEMERQVGKLHVTYASPSDRDLATLIEESATFSERLAALAERPGSLRLGKTSGYYEMLCTHEDGRTRWLKIHEMQLTKVDDSLLWDCLQ